MSEWMGYCAFHSGDYKKALSVYEELFKDDVDNEILTLNIACCYFYLGIHVNQLI